MSWIKEVNEKLLKHREIIKKHNITDGKLSQSASSTANNKRTWADPKIRKKRTEHIIKSKQEQGAVPHWVIEGIYKGSWGDDRRTDYIDTVIKKYSEYLKNVVNQREYLVHVINNSKKSVSKKQHKKNLEDWNDQWFGTWLVYSPGKDLLEDYDDCFNQGSITGNAKRCHIAPSVIYHIRFNMKESTPKEIRDYLLPWTNGEYLKSRDGTRVENGRYLNYRNKQYPYLTDENGTVTEFTNRKDLENWLCKMLNKKSLSSNTRFWQILEKPVKELGPLAGYKIIRKHNEQA